MTSSPPTSVGGELRIGDARQVLPQLLQEGLGGSVRTIVADPPYGLRKADWDGATLATSEAFHLAWLEPSRQLLHPDGTLWVFGVDTMLHVVGVALARLGMPLINTVTVVKTNPRPCWGDKFTPATETLLWVARDKHSRHTYNWHQLCADNGGKEPTSVWPVWRATPQERRHGHHPTQKPLKIIRRCVMASTGPGDLVLDPFMGSGTTGVAALEQGCQFIGIDQEPAYVEVARRRLAALRCERRRRQ